eukprot:COSAG04_NODE_11672_length_695_cov_0.798658_1_plen_21_part_01
MDKPELRPAAMALCRVPVRGA